MGSDGNRTRQVLFNQGLESEWTDGAGIDGSGLQSRAVGKLLLCVPYHCRRITPDGEGGGFVEGLLRTLVLQGFSWLTVVHLYIQALYVCGIHLLRW